MIRESRLVTNTEISSCVGRFSFFGGISPELTCSIISAQWCVSAPSLKSRESRSIRKSPFSFSGPWQRMQWFSRKASNGSAARAAPAQLRLAAKKSAAANHEQTRRQEGLPERWCTCCKLAFIPVTGESWGLGHRCGLALVCPSSAQDWRVSQRFLTVFLRGLTQVSFKLGPFLSSSSEQSRCVNCRWILGRPDPVASVRFRHPRDPGKGSAVARPHHDSGQGGYLKAVRRRNPRRDGGRPPRARNPRRMSKVNSFRLKDPCSPLL